MPAYTLPAFLGQPADPAAHYATGLQIGVRIGQENAAREYQQQQLLRQQAQDAFEQQYKSTQLQLEVDKIRRKQQAVDAYTQMVNSGVPAEQALMQIGPELGESVNEILRTQMMGKQQQENRLLRKQQLEDTRAYREDVMSEREADRAERQRAAMAREEETKKYHEQTAESRLQTNRLRAEKAMETDAVLGQLQGALMDAQSAVESENKSWFGPSKAKLAQYQKAATEAAQAVERRKAQLLNQFGVPNEGGASTEPDQAGIPMPEQPASPSASPTVGQIVKQGGKRYKFQGGNPKDTANYTPLD